VNRLLALALLGTVLGHPSAAEPVLVVHGELLRSGKLTELLPLPDGRVLRATDVMTEFVRTGRQDGIVAYDVDAGRFREDFDEQLGDGAIDRLPGDLEWHLLEKGAFVPLGRAPTAPFTADAVFLATAAAPAAADSDGDGVADANDVCTLVADGPAQPKPQRDTNDDGFGNLCDADLNDDGIVNFGDLALLRRAFFSADPNADLNGDGVVNFSDLAILKRGFLKPPGPSGRAPATIEAAARPR
jgi:predicted flap endonuclease-1-like 5' DNA nuclease